MLLANEQGVQLVRQFHIVISWILTQVTRRRLQHLTDRIYMREMLEDLGLKDLVEGFDPLKQIFIFPGDYWDSLRLIFYLL